MKIEIDVDCEDGFKYRGFDVLISPMTEHVIEYQVKMFADRCVDGEIVKKTIFQSFKTLLEAIKFIDNIRDRKEITHG